MKNYKQSLIILIVVLTFFSCSYFIPIKQTKEKDVVILLHGLGRTNRSMSALENKFIKSGFKAHNIQYPSLQLPLEELVDYLHQRLENLNISQFDKVHFVTHSMGGILARFYLKEHKTENLGRVVMISPPNHGSELADILKDSKILYSLIGPATIQLGTDSLSVPNLLGAVDFDLGIITGNKNLNPFYEIWFSGENDGKVSVESAKIEGMKDFLVIYESHQQILYSQRVSDQVLYFLDFGKFEKK